MLDRASDMRHILSQILNNHTVSPVAEDAAHVPVRIEKNFEEQGQERRFVRQSYWVADVPGVRASLIVLDYGDDEVGRVINSIQIYPEAARGKGYAQALYLAALRDGPIAERSQFRSADASRAFDKLIEKGLVERVEEGGRTLIKLIGQPITEREAPVQHSVADSEAFMHWFAGSKIVDRTGRPLLCYHGTIGDITAFDPDRSNSKSKTGAPPSTFFFSLQPDVAASYAGQYTWMTGHKEWREGGNVMPVYLAIKRPLKIDAKGDGWRELQYRGEDYDINELAAFARSKGYDGLVVRNVHDQGEGLRQKGTTIVAFSPRQIKSAFNRGTWDPETDHIGEGVWQTSAPSR